MTYIKYIRKFHATGTCSDGRRDGSWQGHWFSEDMGSIDCVKLDMGGERLNSVITYVMGQPRLALGGFQDVSTTA